MTLSLAHLRDQEVIELTQENMVDIMRKWSNCTDAFQVIEDDECFRVTSSIPHPLFNNVLKTNVEFDSKRFVKSIRKEYKKRKTPFLWRLWDHDKPKDIETLLMKNGGQKFQSTTLMAIDLDEFDPFSERPPELMVQTLKYGADARKFAECTCTTFGIPNEMKVPVTEIIEMQDQNIGNYIGYIGSTAVGTATRFYSNGIAGIYNVATLPQFQGKGIGMEILNSLLLDVKQDGYQTVILHATPAGLRLYEKLGFQAYGEMKQYFFE